MIMRAPVRQNRRRAKTNTVKWAKPPSRGWNAKDDLADMHPQDAVVLDNLIPTESGVNVRKGKASHVTGIGSTIRSMFKHPGIDGSYKFFAATADAVYEVSSAGAVGAADLSSLSNGNWLGTMMETSGGNFWCMVNNADGFRTYDGSSWATQTITGVDANDLVSLHSHMSRIWGVERDTLNAWYLPVDSIAGAMTKFPLGGLSRKGGYLVAIASWTRDGGEGLDDVCCFITSEGEVHIYSGTDPSSASTWSRVGTFDIAKPIGRKCVRGAGPDCAILTSIGLLPLSAAIGLARSAQANVAVTDGIRKAFQTQYEGQKDNTGWEITEFSSENLVIVNVPIVDGLTYYQYVMNIRNRGAWCRFKNFNAHAFLEVDDELYFGDVDGTIWKYDGNDDDGSAIDVFVVQAYQHFGSSNEKVFHRIQPRFFGPPGYAPSIGLRIDFDETDITYPAAAYTAPGSYWDEEEWDLAVWGVGQVANELWQGVSGKGFVAAIIFSASLDEPLTFNGARISFTQGDGI